MMKTHYTNGVIEGIYNQIKVIKRIAFGYRSFYHFNARTLMIHPYNPIKLERQLNKRRKESVVVKEDKITDSRDYILIKEISSPTALYKEPQGVDIKEKKDYNLIKYSLLEEQSLRLEVTRI